MGVVKTSPGMSCVKIDSSRQGRRGRLPVENIKEDIYTARKVKDTLGGCYPLNKKSEKTLDFV